MAKRQKKFEEDHSNDWLNTYADMVTLLLTFFVMLYASSSLDEQKWQFIYQAFQSHGKFVNDYVRTQDPVAVEGDGISSENPETNGGEGELPQSFDRLYVYLSEYIKDNNLEGQVALEQGAAHITLTFDDNVFFDPNSYVLKPEGKALINSFAPGLRAAESFIRTCTVTGHTAAAISAENDWSLSAERAASVVNHMEFKIMLPTNKFRVRGYGCTEPIEDNSTPEGRAKNRRVDITFLRSDIDPRNEEQMMDILLYDYGIIANKTDSGNRGDSSTEKLPDGSAQLIIDSIDARFPDSESGSIGYVGPIAVGDYSSFLISAESEPKDDGGDDNAEDSE